MTRIILYLMVLFASIIHATKLIVVVIIFGIAFLSLMVIEFLIKRFGRFKKIKDVTRIIEGLDIERRTDSYTDISHDNDCSYSDSGSCGCD